VLVWFVGIVVGGAVDGVVGAVLVLFILPAEGFDVEGPCDELGVVLLETWFLSCEAYMFSIHLSHSPGAHR